LSLSPPPMQDLAACLFDRIAPWVRQSDYEGRCPLGFGQQGRWKPARMNECCKV
jgi:hypothetical protein